MRADRPIIPAPPPWMFWAIIIVAAITLLLNACSYPLRLDPHRDDLQWKQKQCLDKGGSPQECQP
jgi:hypothetical protein